MAVVTTNDKNYQDIADAIREKGVAGAFLPSQMAGAILSISSGSTEVPDAGVFFIDYKGDLVTAWDASDVAGKTAVPANPTHTGLVAQGWNWTLTQIKSYISKYPNASVYVGQMYNTTSGWSEFDITLTSSYGKTVTFSMSGNKDWGDGTQNSENSHTYAEYGDYTIKCNGSNVYAYDLRDILTEARVGTLATSLKEYAFNGCGNLQSVTIPNSVQSFGVKTFQYCYGIKGIVIPSSVESIGGEAFEYCYALSVASLSGGGIDIGSYAFEECYALKNITLPDGVDKVVYSLFCKCYSLARITIPDSVESVESYSFNECCGIVTIDCSSATSVPNCSNSTFGNNGYVYKIIVPAALYSQWIAKSGWSGVSGHIFPV